MKHLQSLYEKVIIDKEINEKIEKFRNLQNEIAKLASELAKKKKEFGEFDKLVQPILTSMKDTGDRLAETDHHLIKITKFGYESLTSSYKAAYDLALTKVNKATKVILENALEETQSIRKVSNTYSIDKNSLDEGLESIIATLKKGVQIFLSLFNRESKNIDLANKELYKLTKREPKALREV